MDVLDSRSRFCACGAVADRTRRLTRAGEYRLAESITQRRVHVGIAAGLGSPVWFAGEQMDARTGRTYLSERNGIDLEESPSHPYQAAGIRIYLSVSGLARSGARLVPSAASAELVR